jgi:GntR family transcriptional regulator/MocR family aminotransferase
MLLTLDGEGALYMQVYRSLKQQILAGRLREGERLPASRWLAESLGVSRNVVLQGYDQLKSEGFIVGRVGAGTRVADHLGTGDVSAGLPSASPRGKTVSAVRLTQQASIALAHWQARTQPGTLATRTLDYDFRYGDIEVDALSARIWRRLSGRMFTNSVHQYGHPQGEPVLREIIAEYAGVGRGCDCDPEQVCIVNGSQQALDILARMFLSTDSQVIVEEPGYPGARTAFQAAGATLVPVPVDLAGIKVEQFPDSGGANGLIYVTPSHQFPTGSILSLSRRLALLEWAQRHNWFIVEDDYDGEFRYAGRPIPALQGLDPAGRTLYVGTFSKVLFPALRIGYVVLPGNLVEPFVGLRWLCDRHTVTHQQRVLAAFIREGHYERHLRRMRKRYQGRRRALIDALHQAFGAEIELHGTNAGLHLLVWFREDALAAGASTLIAAARAAGVGVYPVSPLYQQPPGRLGLLFGYGGIPEARIAPGIDRLRRVFAERR